MREFKLVRKEDTDFDRRKWDEDLSQTEEMEGKTSVGIMLRSGSWAQGARPRESGPGSQAQNGYL